MTIPTISQLPAGPILAVDTEEEFSTKVDAYHTALPGWIDELNAFAPALVAASTGFYNATSISSVAIGTGARTFAIETGKAYVAGQFVLIVDADAPTVNWMLGQVIALDSATGDLDVDVSVTKGGGTKDSWVIGLTGVNRPLNDGNYGDIAISGDGTTYTIRANTVTNAKLADMATARLKGRASAGAGDPEDLTGAQATALLDVFTAAAKGLVPAGSASNPALFLAGDGLFRSPSADASAWAQIQSVALAGTSVAFTAIPSSFSDLELELSGLDFNGAGLFTIELSADGATWNGAASVFNESVSGANTYHGAIHLSHYRRDLGPAIVSLSNATFTAGFGTNIALGSTIWRCPGGIMGIRLGFSGTGFSAGTATLFGR